MFSVDLYAWVVYVTDKFMVQKMESFVNARVFVLISTIVVGCTIRPTAHALSASIVCAHARTHAPTTPLFVILIDIDR